METEGMSLATIGLGAAIEKFDHELSNVVSNIMDPNTDIDKVREITLTVKIKPVNMNREVCGMETSVKSKLAPTSSILSQIAVGVIDEHGSIGAREYVQQELFTKEKGKITMIGG